MNKTEFVAAVAEKTGLKKKETETTINSAFEILSDLLANGDKLQVVGFGSFETRHRAARKGRNPKTKEEIDIPASTTPVFKPGKALKEAVNK